MILIKASTKNGVKTNHQLQAINPSNLAITNMIVSTLKIPIRSTTFIHIESFLFRA